MKISKHKSIVHYSGCLLLTVLASNLEAQEESVTQDWTCQRCLSTTGWELDIEAGPAYVNDDAYHFGDYTGIDEEGIYLFGDVSGRYWDKDARYMNFEGFNLGPDAGAFFIEGGKQSAYEVRASYQAIPRRFFNSTVTPYSGNGTDKLTLPSSWVRAPTTQQMTALDSTAGPVDIKRDWDIYSLGIDLSPMQHWNMRVDYTRREREGQNISSGSFLFSAAEFTTPIDYSSDDIEVELSYSKDWWQTSITYFGSIFNNENHSLNWDNPYSSSTGVDSGQMALAPDNSSHQVSLAGSMLLPARTTLSGQLSIGRLKQDEDLLPYTTNTSIATSPLPLTSADAEADTLNVNLRAVTSPWDKITLESELRYNDFDNKTVINNYNYVNTDSTIAPSPVTNSAYDYTRRDIKFRGEYRISYNLKFQGGIDTQRFERNNQDRNHTTTNKLWFRTRSRIGRDAKVDVELFTEERDGSSYNTNENSATPENPMMRKSNMADRDREGIKVQGSIFGGGTTDVGWEIEYSKDGYSDSLGLEDSRYLRFGMNFTRLLNKNASLYASLYNEHIETDQNNSQSFSAPDWSASTEDTFTTATVGIVYPKIIGSIDATLDYTWSRSEGETDNNTSGLESSFPDLRTERHIINLGLSYPYSKSLSFGFDYMYENFESDDYALDGVEPDTVSNLMSLGADSYNYGVSAFYLSMRYQLSPK